MDRITKSFWQSASTKLVPCALVWLAGTYLAVSNGGRGHHAFHQEVLRLVGVALYIIFSLSFLHILTTNFYKHSSRRIGIGRAAAVRFTIRIAGYIIIVLGLLSLLHIPVARLLFGGAIIGVILGVAAQQSLANFFASVVIIIDRTFTVGEDVTIISGTFGGSYTGTVSDISFSHTRLHLPDGASINLPNAILLSGTAIIRLPRGTVTELAAKHAGKTAKK